MARKLIVEILGDSSSLERSFNRSTVAANKFGKNVDTMGGRLDRTAKKFTNIQTAFVGGLAFTAAAAGIRSVVTAAAESQQVLGQTSVALEATGHSWAQYGDQIEKVIQQQSRLGFDDEALLRTFSLFVRSTSNINEALKLNALATDVARGRYIDLEQAAQLVNKAALGQAGALRRLGIDVKNGATAQQLLTALTEKYGGAAQAAGKDASTAFDRAQVSIENAKEQIGGNLLPTVAGLANTLSDTLELFTKIGKTKIPAIHIPLLFDFNTGDSTVSKLVHKGLFTLPEFVDLTKNIVTNLIDDFRGETVKAKPGAARDVGLVMSNFLDNVLISASKQVRPSVSFGDLLGDVLASGREPINLGPLITDLPIKTQQQVADAELAGKGIRAAHVKALKVLTDALADPRLKAKDRLSLTRAAKSEQDAINSIDDAAAAAADQSAADAANKRETAREKRAQQRADAARKARERREKIAERERREAAKAAKREQIRQFRLVGLGPEGGEIVPGIPNLRKQLAQLEKSVVGQPVPKKLLNRLAGVAKALTDPIHKATPETRKAIQELFDTIRGTFSEEANKPVADIRTVSLSDKILKALGFDTDLKAIQPKITLPSISTPGTTTTTAGTLTARESNVNINGSITVVANNPDAFLRELQKTAGRASATSRGRFPGRNLGLS